MSNKKASDNKGSGSDHKGADKPAPQEGILGKAKHALTDMIYGTPKPAAHKTEKPAAKTEAPHKPGAASKAEAPHKPGSAAKSSDAPKPKPGTKAEAPHKPGSAAKSDTPIKAKPVTKPESSHKPGSAAHTDAPSKHKPGAKPESPHKPGSAAHTDTPSKHKPGAKPESPHKPGSAAHSDAPSKHKPGDKPDSPHKPGTKAETPAKETDNGQKKHKDTDSKSESFSFQNLTKMVVDTGKKFLDPEPEKIVNKVEHADKLTPKQRAEKHVDKWVDPTTGARHEYDKDGYLKELQTKDHQRSRFEYDEKTHQLKNFSRVKTDEWTWRGRKSTGYAEAVDGKVVLDVNQKTGEVKTSSHEMIDQKDPKTLKAEKIEVKSEFFFHADGTKSALTRELNGRRISKNLLSADDKQTGKVFYQYTDQAPGKPPNPEAPVLAVQYGKDSRINHKYEYQNSDAVEKQKAAIREDIKYKADGPINTEKHATYDLRSGKEVILSRVEKTIDNKIGHTKVHEEQYQKGKLATDHTVTFDEHAKAIDMRFKDLNAKVDLKVSFDINGKAHDIKGDQKNLVDKSTLLAIADGQTARIKEQHKVGSIDAGEMLAYNGPTPPREGGKPTGVVAWKEAGSTEYVQGTAENGVLRDTDGRKIGTINDKGDVSIDGKQSFNILTDKQYSAVFHGVGTDTHPLDLCATQSIGDAKRQEGMNGYVARDGSKILMVGGNMFGEDGKFVARMDESGHLQFAKGTNPPQDAGTDITSFMHDNWVFKGNENGNERRFFVENASNGKFAIPPLDAKGQPQLDANGKPMAPTDCEVRLGMVIDKSSQKQLSNFIPPTVNADKSFSGGYIISMDGQGKPLSDLTGASFNIQVLGRSDKTHMIGVAAGPQQFQADGTPVPGIGGVINIQREIELEDQHLKNVTADRDKAVSTETNEKIGATVMLAPLDVTGTIARTNVDGYNEFMGNKQQTDALRTRQELAQKHHDETVAQLKTLLDTGAIDANLLYKLQSGNAKIRESQLAPVDQQRYLNPEHKLETIVCDPSEINGFIKRPDLKNPGLTQGYDLRSSLVYKQGTDQCIGEIDAKTGTMKIYSASGKVETTRMNDPKLAGTIIHMEYPGHAGAKQTTDWLSDGTGKLQSFNEMRKQAADQVRFVRSKMGDDPNFEGVSTIERTQERANRLNKNLDQMLKDGVTTVSVGKDGSFNLDPNFQKILEGPRKNVLAEKLLVEERQPPPKKLELHQLRNQDDCSKTSGPMRIGAELLYCKNGKMFHGKMQDGKVAPTGDCIGTLEPGYVVNLGNRTIALQNESQFLFQFTVDGENREHRVFGTGAAHVDATGAFAGGGLVEADQLLREGHNSKKDSVDSMNKYYEEKPSGNYVADFLGWTTNKVLDDREAQMRYVGETIDNSNAGLSHQIDDMFQRGFSEKNASSNNRIDQNVNTVNRYMRDLNLSAGDMDSMSAEGRSMQKQASEGVAMGLMSVVPGGVGLLATRLGVTSVVARTGMAFVAGGTISATVRQTEKSDAGRLFLSGGVEAATMFAGAEGMKTLQTLKIVNSARTLKAGETLSKEAMAVLLNPETASLMKNAAAQSVVEMMGKPGGSAAVEAMFKVAHAGFSTTGLTAASSYREGNYDQMTPGKILENSTYMLAADVVAMAVHAPAPKLFNTNEKVREVVQNFSKESINNFANSALTGRVQAHEAELENIARERHIPKELISETLFEKYKNQTRINTFILNTAAEGMATTFVTSPMGHVMERATTQYAKAAERSTSTEVHLSGDGAASPHMVPDLVIKGGGEIPDSLIGVLIPLKESKTGFSRNLPDGSSEQWLHSGGQLKEKGGKVTYVQDANGRETHVKYDDNGEVTRLDVTKGGHKEVWVKDGAEWIVDTNGQKFRSNEKISVDADGSISHQSADGTHAFKPDGAMHLSDGKGQEKLIAPNPDEPLQRDYFDKMVQWHVEDPAVQRALRASSNHLMERVILNEKVEQPVLNKDLKTEYKKIGNIERVEYAKCLKEVSELLQDHPNAKLDKATRQRLAEECLWLAANPTYLSQGKHPTCAVAAVEVGQYLQHPSDVIKAVKELALTGEYKCPDGKVLKPFTAGGEFIFKPDDCAMSHYEKSPIGRADGRRLMASQLWQHLAVSAHYATVDSFKGQVVGEGNIGFHNDYISDMSTNPPRALHVDDGTHMAGNELVGAVKQLTGRSEDLVLLNKRYDGRDPKRHFEEMEDMHGKLWEAFEKGEFPIAFAVNVANPPFNVPGGGEHMVSIVGIKTHIDPSDPRSLSEIFPPRGEIDPATGKQKLPDPKYVELVIDNQWKKQHDRELRSVPLSEAYLASFPVDQATALRPGITSSGDHDVSIRSEDLGRNRSDHLFRTNEKEFAEIKNDLASSEQNCLMDAKVPGTLSEFGFEFELAKAIANTAGDKPDSVVTAFIDLNNFKNVNVLHSMDMGDEALRVFGAEAEKVLRKYNIEPKEALGHFGGDEFGILLKNQEKYRQILDEIMSIRIGCKPISKDPDNQQVCEFVTLAPQEKFEHTAYKIEKDEATGMEIVSEESSPVISATLGAVRWERGMSAEDVLQTADRVMFQKKPIVKAQLNAGGDALLDPFDNTVDVVRDQAESRHLKLFRSLSDKQQDFVAHGMSNEEISSHRAKTVEERANLYFDLLYKHRHTQILDKPKSKERLAQYIEEATANDGKPFSIIKLSIDNFKQVNDRMQSHAKGNRVLHEVGDFLRTLDADFVGSLGGTSPFLIVKDPARAAEIMKKCDEYFLKVSPGNVPPEQIGHFKQVSGNEIAVGLSAGKLEWKPGMDVEMLLNHAEVENKKCELEHIDKGRHTRREQEIELKEGQPDRRAPRPDNGEARKQGTDETGLVHSKKLPSDDSHADKTDISAEQLQLQAGGKWANEKNIARITETLNIAVDKMHVFDPAKNVALQKAEQNWQAAFKDAHEAINAELPGLLPSDTSESNFLDRKTIRRALKEHPDLLELYENAVDSYVDYKRVCRDEINFVRRANAEIINEALESIAKDTGEPPMRVFTTHLGSATAAHKLGTDRLFITDEGLRGMVPLDQLIKDISHEFSHNAQNALIVRKLANDLEIGSKPTEAEILDLQKLYLKRVGQPLETEYLLSALKGNRKFSEGDNQRAEVLIKSFSEIKAGDLLRHDKNTINWAIKKLQSSDGINDVMEQLLKQGTAPENIAKNSLFNLLFPSYELDRRMRLVDKYINHKEDWAKAIEGTRIFWKPLLEQRLSAQNELIEQHQKRYQDWAHEKESSAATELVSRCLEKNHGKRWNPDGTPRVPAGGILDGLEKVHAARQDNGEDDVHIEGLAESRKSYYEEPEIPQVEPHRGVVNTTDALVRGLAAVPLTTSEIDILKKIGLDDKNFDRNRAEQILVLMVESAKGKALLEQVSERPLTANEMRAVQQIYDHNERVIFGETKSVNKPESIEGIRATQRSALDDTAILLQNFADKNATSVLTVGENFQLAQAQHLAKRGVDYLDRLEQSGRISKNELSIRSDLKKHLEVLDASPAWLDKKLNEQMSGFMSLSDQLASGHTAGLDPETQRRLTQNLDKQINAIMDNTNSRQIAADLARLNETVNHLITEGSTNDDQFMRQMIKEVSDKDLKNQTIIEAVDVAKNRLQLMQNPDSPDNARRLQQLENSLLNFAKNSGDANEARFQLTKALSDAANGTDGRFERLVKFANLADEYPDVPIAFRQIISSDAKDNCIDRYLDFLMQHSKNTGEDLRELAEGQTTKGDDMEELCCNATMKAAQRGDLGAWTFVPTGKHSTADDIKIDGIFLDLTNGEMVPIDFTMKDKKDLKWFYQLPDADKDFGNKAAIYAARPDVILNFIDALQRDRMTFSVDQFEQKQIPFPSLEHWTGATPAGLRESKEIMKLAQAQLKKPNENWSTLGRYAQMHVNWHANTAHAKLHSSDPVKAAREGVRCQNYLKGVGVPDTRQNQIIRDMVDALDVCQGSCEEAFKIALQAPLLRSLGVSDHAVMKDIVKLCVTEKSSMEEAGNACVNILPGIAGDGGTLKDAIAIAKLHNRLRENQVTVSDTVAYNALRVIAEYPKLSPTISVALSKVPTEFYEHLLPVLSGAGKISKEDLVELALDRALEANGVEEKAWIALHKEAQQL